MKPDVQPPAPDETVRIPGNNISIFELKEKLKKAGYSGKVVPHSDNLPEDQPALPRRPDDEVLPREVTLEELIELVQSLPKNKISKVFEAATQIADSKLPVVAPALWANRSKGTTVSQFYDLHWAEFAGKGLSRNLIRQLDRTYYYTLSKWLSRQNNNEIPPNMRVLLDTPSDRVKAELTSANIVEPRDAYKAFPDDQKKADRLYQAAWARQPE